MPNMNRSIIVGHLGRDPELRYTQSGRPVCNFSVATSFGKDDNRRTEWHNIVVWGDLAEVVSEEFVKGDAVHIEGYKQTQSWESKEGEKRSNVQVVATYVARPIYKKRNRQSGVATTDGDYVDGGDDVPF